MSIVVLIGPSGGGKSTVAKILQAKFGYRLEKTVTTRPQRGPLDNDHIFVIDETFDSMLASKMFYGTMEFKNHRYGLPRFNPETKTLLLLRAPAVEKFRARFPDAIIFEIDASATTLEERLIARGSSDRIDPAALEQEITLGRRVAKYTIDTARLTPYEVADKIIEAAEAS